MRNAKFKISEKGKSIVNSRCTEVKMNRRAGIAVWLSLAWLAFILAEGSYAAAADTSEQLIAGAKKEGDEIVFVAGAQTFGGRKGLSEIEGAFNKKFGLKAHINFAAGPDMNARAARLITEVKAGGKSSSDFYLGSQSHFALLHKENALEKINWSGT